MQILLFFVVYFLLLFWQLLVLSLSTAVYFILVNVYNMIGLTPITPPFPPRNVPQTSHGIPYKKEGVV